MPLKHIEHVFVPVYRSSQPKPDASISNSSMKLLIHRKRLPILLANSKPVVF